MNDWNQSRNHWTIGINRKIIGEINGLLVKSLAKSLDYWNQSRNHCRNHWIIGINREIIGKIIALLRISMKLIIGELSWIK